MSEEAWVFENLSNWGKGGSKCHAARSRNCAQDMAHEQLRGWYCHHQYVDGEGKVFQGTLCWEIESSYAINYLNRKGEVVGKVYPK